MTFNSIYFLLVFLPIAVILYYLLPGAAKKIALLVLSVVYCVWSCPAYLVVLAVSLIVNYVLVQNLSSSKNSSARSVLLGGIALNIAVLLVFRYGAVVLPDSALAQLQKPFGLSFYTLTVIGYLIDVYRKDRRLESPLDFAFYLTFFPRVLAGPAMRREEFRPRKGGANLNAVGRGLSRFIIGLAKKVLLADTLAVAVSGIQAQGQISILTAWLGAVFMALEIYFDFSGYMDMAIGLADLFGYHFEENFRTPFASGGISEFLTRWASSLIGWFRTYVYELLGGGEDTMQTELIALGAVSLAAAMWHGISWKFLVFGVVLFALLFLEKLLGEFWQKVPGLFRVIINNILLMVEWVLLMAPSLKLGGQYLGSMIGIGGAGMTDGYTGYYFINYLPALIISVLCCTTLPRTLQERLVYRGKGKISMVINVIVYAALLVLCIAVMSAGSDPFIYAQF